MNQGLIKLCSCNEARNSKRMQTSIYNAIIMIIQVHENFSYDQIYIRIETLFCVIKLRSAVFYIEWSFLELHRG